MSVSAKCLIKSIILVKLLNKRIDELKGDIMETNPKVRDIVNDIKVDSNNIKVYMSLLSPEEQKEALKLLREETSIEGYNWIKKNI